eukprot:3368208-Pyramimonas_sp.AAC.2
MVDVCACVVRQSQTRLRYTFYRDKVWLYQPKSSVRYSSAYLSATLNTTGMTVSHTFHSDVRAFGAALAARRLSYERTGLFVLLGAGRVPRLGKRNWAPTQFDG